MIDGGRHHIALRVAMGSQCASDVDPVHEAPAKEGAKGIRIVGKNYFGHLGRRVAYRTPRELETLVSHPAYSEGARWFLSFLVFALRRESITAFKVRLQKALRQSLNSKVRMRLNPPVCDCFKVQIALFARQVVQLRNITKRDLSITVTKNRETYSVGGAIVRQARTVTRITEVAALLQLFIGWRCAFMSWRATESAVTGAQWEA